MSAECLDCALFECDRCESVWNDNGGCCCGRVAPSSLNADDDDYLDGADQ